MSGHGIPPVEGPVSDELRETIGTVQVALALLQDRKEDGTVHELLETLLPELPEEGDRVRFVMQLAEAGSHLTADGSPLNEMARRLATETPTIREFMNDAAVLGLVAGRALGELAPLAPDHPPTS